MMQYVLTIDGKIQVNINWLMQLNVISVIIF